jgi:hypothetical protein
MTIPLIVITVVIVAAVVLFIRPRIASTYQIGIHDIPRVLAELATAKSAPAFAVFMFVKPGSSDAKHAINLQFSLEDRRVGFDWVLIGPTNVEDQSRFTEFASSAGYAPKLEVMNGVKYLRVEEGDLAALCRTVVIEMYGLSEAEQLEMIVQGFRWEGPRAAGLGHLLVNRKSVL